MQAEFIDLEYVQTSKPPKIRFHIKITNNENEIFSAFGFNAELRLIVESNVTISIYLGELIDSVRHLIRLQPKDNLAIFLDYTLYPINKYIIEEARTGDLKFNITLRCYRIIQKDDVSQLTIESKAENVLHRYSNDIVIPRSKWADILSESGYEKNIIIELPVDYGEIIRHSKSLIGTGLKDRLSKSSKQLEKIIQKMNKGDWREVVSDSREVIETLKKGEGDSQIGDLLKISGFPDENVTSFKMLIEQIKNFSSLAHHIPVNGKEVKTAVPMDREDAIFILTSITTIINLLTKKFDKQILA